MRPVKFDPAVCVWTGRAILGEGPAWSFTEQKLYWVDIKAPAIHRFDPTNNTLNSWPMPEMIGCILEGDDGWFAVAMQSGFAKIKFPAPGTEPVLHPISDPEFDVPSNRFNDGKRAPDGSIWAGSMDADESSVSGRWWRLDPCGTTSVLNNKLFGVTNGPAFDVSRNRVYLTDSAAQIIYVGDLVEGGRAAANLREFLRFAPSDGFPDGMTIDPFGGLLVAFWDGSCLRRFSPDGHCIQTIKMPVQRPTSVCFTDDGMTLYVTSASIGLPVGGLDGGLFSLSVCSSAGE